MAKIYVKPSHAPFCQIQNFISLNPKWPHQKKLLTNAERALAQESDDETIIHGFSRYPPKSGKGKIRLAEAYMSYGQKAKATPLIRDAWANAKFPARDEKAVYRRYQKYLTEKDHTARLDRLLWNAQLSEARLHF